MSMPCSLTEQQKDKIYAEHQKALAEAVAAAVKPFEKKPGFLHKLGMS
jgi:hypothetical protein